MADAGRTQRLGENARRVFDAGYTRQVCAAKYAEVLRLADPRATPAETAERREKLAAWLAEGAAVEIDAVHRRVPDGTEAVR
jgi:hypothetical protein